MNKWTLYRLELVYFDATYKRWRLCQESYPAPPNSPSTEFRSSIQKVLGAIRNSLTPSLADNGFKLMECQTQTKRSAKLELEDWRLKKLFFEVYGPIASKVGYNHREVWSTLLNYYITLANEERLPELVKRLEAAKTHYRPQESGVSDLIHRFTRQQVRDLISLLPVQSHWDVPGAISLESARHSHTTKLHNIGDQMEPWYAARLVFPDRHGQPNAESAPSQKVLGYEVRLSVMYTDLSRPDLAASSLDEDDYFTYCFNPQPTVRGEAADHTEWASYLTYAAFIDRFQLELAPDDDNPLDDIFYLAYQIVSPVGRKHFLHLYMKPDESHATLRHLYHAWIPFHRSIGWPQIHAMLASELEQIDLDRFREQLTEKLNSSLSSGPSLEVEEAVCHFAYLLFPIEQVECNNKTWHYETAAWPDGTYTQFSVGQRWVEAELPAIGTYMSANRVSAKGNIAFTLETPKRSNRAVEELRRYRCNSILDQQVAWARKNWKGKGKT